MKKSNKWKILDKKVNDIIAISIICFVLFLIIFFGVKYSWLWEIISIDFDAIKVLFFVLLALSIIFYPYKKFKNKIYFIAVSSHIFSILYIFLVSIFDLQEYFLYFYIFYLISFFISAISLKQKEAYTWLFTLNIILLLFIIINVLDSISLTFF